MRHDRDPITEYFAPSARWLWEWRDEGDVITWSDGTTLTFRAEILDLLVQLETIGLPRFGSLVLFLAACRSGWLNSKGRASLRTFVSDSPYATGFFELSMKSIEAMDRLHGLRDLFTDSSKIAAVARIVFERTSERLTPQQSAVALRALRNRMLISTSAGSVSASQSAIARDLRVLFLGIKRLDRPSLEQELKTGIDRSVKPISHELPLGLSARQLMRLLIDDENLGGVARLAMRISAAIQLPRPHLDAEELAVGGVNDITNHGTLDRLLLSELVHDDLTLAVRVAMNEALYMRREPQARNPTRQSFVLIDAGLRMWGLPRVFATAVGLAVAARADHRLTVSAWRASGEQIVPIDFTTAQGLTQHLAALDHRVHPGLALAEFVRQVQQADSPTEALLITTEAVLSDREFTQALNQCDFESWQIAVVQRDGGFRFLQRTRRGMKILSTAQIALNEILELKPAAPSLMDVRKVSLPAIYFAQPFPLRVPVPIELDNSWSVQPWGTITLTNDGRLLLWDAPKQGPREIATGLPSGPIRWCSPRAQDGAITLVAGALSQRGLYVCQLAPDRKYQTIHPLKLDAGNPKWIVMCHPVLMVLFEKRINVLDPTTGNLLDACENPFNTTWQSRYVWSSISNGPPTWSAISFDGEKIGFLPLPNQPPRDVANLFVIDSPEHGLIGVTKSIDFFIFQKNQVRRINHIVPNSRWAFLGMSRDGERVLFRQALVPGGLTPRHELVDIRSGQAYEVRGKPEAMLEPLARGLDKPPPLRRRFRGILINPSGQLALVSRKESTWPIMFHPTTKAIAIPKMPATLRPDGEIQRFETMDSDLTGGRELQIATWPDGSVAILDTLGVLNLRSSDPTIPECSIVLGERRTSGWVADERCWGDAYFVGDRAITDAEVIYREVIVPFVERVKRRM